MSKFYMVYLAADDTIVATGSAQECTEQMGLKNKHSFLSIVSKVRKGTFKKYEIIDSDSDTLDDEDE